MKNKWKCTCGYIHDGDQPPAHCPKCGTPAKDFTLLDQAVADLIERSRHTNALHCRLVDIGRKMEKLCKDGIQDKLDPGCVDVFQKALAHSYEIMKLATTEIQIHIGKNKWG